MQRIKLAQAKVQLYHEILCMDPNTMRDCDIELGFVLAKDPDIQRILESATKRHIILTKEDMEQ